MEILKKYFSNILQIFIKDTLDAEKICKSLISTLLLAIDLDTFHKKIETTTTVRDWILIKAPQ